MLENFSKNLYIRPVEGSFWILNDASKMVRLEKFFLNIMLSIPNWIISVKFLKFTGKHWIILFLIKLHIQSLLFHFSVTVKTFVLKVH